MLIKFKLAMIAVIGIWAVAATGIATHTYVSAWVANKIFAIG
jgi:hypothetical protein